MPSRSTATSIAGVVVRENVAIVNAWRRSGGDGGARRDMRLKESGPREHRVEREATAERVAAQHAIRGIDAVFLFDERNDLVLDHAEKLVGLALGRGRVVGPAQHVVFGVG